jgi:hypothetical protein
MSGMWNKYPEGRIPLEFSWTSYRSQRLRAAQRSKLDAVFVGREFEVVEKIDWTGTGKFFHTPIGHRGIRGYRLVEVADPSNEVFLGERTLASAKQLYTIRDTISEMPDEPLNGM